ncbi:macrophage mannose receptor 1-like [Cloeon dipterum]|uniref:macrophage mannose receptor 1-like n=1 Tax=Cloeon dipterum TaxID=197152 RepID=UPI00321FD888
MITTKLSSSTRAITSAKTPPSTTTPPPSLADLIVGKCESSFPPDKGLFEINGRLKDPDKFGFWVTSCNQLFVFGKSLVTWRENTIKCASIGMQPIEIGNDAKYQCFKKLAINWKYGSNYWTSGLRTQGKNFSWCHNNNGSVRFWAPGQPDNLNGSENCVHMNIKTENTTVYLTDKKCTNINVFSCQGPTTPPPPCTSPVCPNITCKRNMSLYTNSTKEGKTSFYLAYPDMFGSWYKKNNRFYFYSYPNKTQTFLGAMKACCDLGMNLLSLQFDYKFDAVLAGVKEKYTNPGHFWTSGTDSGCESTFGFCAVNRLVRKDTNNWQRGQPNNAGGAENHLAVYINGSSALMADFNGDSKLRYICEARDTTKSASGGKAVRDECAAIYNVSMSEIDNMLNNTNYDLRMKCFIKCIGENSDLMIDGKFVESEFLAILEKLAAGNLEEFKKNMMIEDECVNSTGGMDECDKAAQLIKCANEKAPDVLMSVVDEMERSISQSESAQEIALLRPQPAFCVQDFPCFIDVGSFKDVKYGSN